MTSITKLPWLTPAITQFSQQIITGNLAHALLIGVDEGYGGQLLVEQLAATALCMSPTPSGACGNCKSCLLKQAGSHPDHYIVAADGNQIKVDQIRQLCNALSQTAQQGGRRVAIIMQSERLNHAAANALLKTLEEPGEGTLLLLQSNIPSQLLPTIRSRCQQLQVTLPDEKALKQWLTNYHNDYSAEMTWCLAIVGGPLALIEAQQSGRYQQLVSFRKDWIQSLKSTHLSGSLLSLTEPQIIDALGVLFLLLRHKLIKNNTIDALQRVELVKLSSQISRTITQLQHMSRVNYTALCQQFLTQYIQLTSKPNL